MPPLWGLQLPAIEVFEIFVSAQQMLILAALGLAFGWRIVLFLAVVCKFPCTADVSAPYVDLVCSILRELVSKADAPVLSQLLSSK